MAMGLLAGCQAIPRHREAGVPQEPRYILSPYSEGCLSCGRDYGTVFFANGSSQLESEAKESLLDQAKWLKRHPALQITLAGHCDNRGSRPYNHALGLRRARAARDFLVGHGVKADQIAIVSYGKDKPVATGNDPEARRRNRSVVSLVR
jgi:peptidoglycan-associated lipoprotein